MISKITLENFSAFENISLDCSSQINVIVGENSSGKTQVLKAAYLLGKASELKSQGKSDSQISAQIKSSFLGMFKPRSRRLGGVVNRNAPQNSRIAIDDAYGLTNEIKIENNKSTETLNILNDSFDAEAGVFIPTKEVLTLLPALESEIVDEKQLRALFDETVVDLCLALLKKELLDEKELLNQDQRLGGVLKLLCKNIKGQYRYRGNDHYFVAGDYQQYRDNSNEFWFKPIPDSELSTMMTAEGYRKIGMIQQLILNGAINNSSKSPLYWDEPESNLNPKLMKMIVKSLLEISRNGKQVFVATHDYALLKWFDLLANKDEKHGDSIRYHLLKKDPDSQKILYEHSDDYSVISKSCISDTYAEIYDADVERALAI
ncbi:AAA family ATPase [Vibrio campbellii]|uniref:AAA family ATPase n=1 Tax=Vibrio campbellii TaxID=680 RepID=A0AAE9MXK9_9VIBR|nr:AAA family ATPase [Vibrio campbellii]UTZ25721.1 AAA family ATPase [Vibrio campbellii]